ncbi:MAG TPA: N-acetylmuramic acid 6-phosphate etherase [Acidobacteriaceae bacterium]
MSDSNSSTDHASALATLLTEARYKPSERIDELSTTEMLQVINAADREVADAVAREIPAIARAVDAIAAALAPERGGRLFYVGAGTSGRLGVLDASECPPTFNAPSTLVQGLIAGGEYALRHSVEGAEDSPELGATDLRAHGFGAKDVLAGIAASGRTPYVLGAMDYARSLGANTIGVSCVPGSAVARAAEIAITPAVGPEVVTGSTRLRAGTATKLVLNMLSTGAMIRLGTVYSNLMVNVQPSNEKLADRAERIVVELTGLPRDQARALFREAGSIKTAVLMHAHGLSREKAEALLRDAHGHLRHAMEAAAQSKD